MACTDPGQLQLDWSTGGAKQSRLQRPAGPPQGGRRHQLLSLRGGQTQHRRVRRC